jgi:quinol monooxygenase YgiN
MMNGDVVVTMDVVLKPEHSARFAQMDPAGLEGTKNFPGCRGVQIVRHKDDANRFLFLERWENEQAYRDYIAWRTESGQFQSLQQMVISIDINIWPQTVITV